MTIQIPDIKDIATAARQFIAAMGTHRVFAFEAPMGAGKTTFISEVCRQLGVDDTANSPSFSIINEYEDVHGKKLYHFDFYRLDDVSEAIEIGAEDYFWSGALCFIEWPDRVEQILPDDTVYVSIKVNDDNSRTISL